VVHKSKNKDKGKSKKNEKNKGQKHQEALIKQANEEYKA